MMARYFKVWQYDVSLSQLLIRSCGIYGGNTDGNVDLIFGGVFYMHFADVNHGFTLTNYEQESFQASEEDLCAAPGFDTVETGQHGKLYVITDGLRRGFVGAGYMRIERNQLAPKQTSLQLPPF
jgi:hypothetical protein